MEMRRAGVSEAALLLAGLVLLAALPRTPAAERAACPRPFELESRTTAPRTLPAEGASLHGERCTSAVGCEPTGPSPAPLRGPAPLLFGRRLDLNCSGTRALEVLPGIGPVRAGAIARERDRRPFASVSELERVPGIGPRTSESLRAWLTVSGECECAASGRGDGCDAALAPDPVEQPGEEGP